MNGVTAESFTFKNKHIQKRKTRKPLLGSGKKDFSPLYLIDPLELSTFGGTFLRPHKIVIHKKVDQHKQISAMAIAMGATLITEGMDNLTSATDLIICGTTNENNVRPRVIEKALENHIRIVSPSWIISCFRDQCYKDPFMFPYQLDSIRKTLKLPALSQVIDANPFHVEEESKQDGFAYPEYTTTSSSPSLPPSTPPRSSKKPTPTKDVAAILNNQALIELLRRKREEQAKQLKKETQKSYKYARKPTITTVHTRNGVSIWQKERN